MRGTTPIHNLILPFGVEMVAKAKVTYKLGDTVLLKKHTADFEMSGKTLSVKLTRQETLKFPDNEIVKVQWEIETPAGDVRKTVVYHLPTGELLDEEELQ